MSTPEAHEAETSLTQASEANLREKFTSYFVVPSLIVIQDRDETEELREQSIQDETNDKIDPPATSEAHDDDVRSLLLLSSGGQRPERSRCIPQPGPAIGP